MTQNSMEVIYPRRYQIRLVTVLCLVFGVVIFEMFGIGNLVPFIKTDLSLSNTQIGILLSGFWVTFAFSSFATGVITDKVGGHKAILQFSLVFFSVASVLSGFATSFFMLLAARLLMGLFDAPVYLIPQSLVVLESPATRIGLNMGIVTNVGSGILGVFLAPLLLVNLASHYGWRVGFFVVALPGLICIALMSAYLRGRSPHAAVHRNEGVTRTGVTGTELLTLLRSRNVWLCAVTSCFVVAYVTVSMGFLPLFFIRGRHISPAQTSALMSVLGISTVVLGTIMPAVSDRLGRKPVMVAAGLLSLAGPLTAMYYSGPLFVLGVALFLGWGLSGASALTFATIPSESVPANSVSTIIGFILAISTLAGGVFGPILAGWSADRWGLSAPLVFVMGCCSAITAACFALTETAPSVLAARDRLLAPSET